MEIKNSTPKAIQPNGTYEGQNGTTYKWNIEMENGDAGEYGSKTVECVKFKVGEATKYEWHDEKYPKIKPHYEKGASAPGSAPKAKSNYNSPERLELDKLKYELDRKKQIMIILQSSLKEAINFHKDSGVYTKDQVMDTMDDFAERIIKNKYLKMLK